MISQNHPDKLAAKGLLDTMREMAEGAQLLAGRDYRGRLSFMVEIAATVASYTSQASRGS